MALDGFEKIAADPDFQELVPLYITQLYHALGQWDRLKEYAPPLLDESSGLDDESVAEVAYLLGDSGTGTKPTTRRRPTSIGRTADGPGRNPEFAYQVGYTRYRLGDWRGASILPRDVRGR